jgi:hypothetical protein
LNDLNKSKALLQKTNFITPIEHSTQYTPSLGFLFEKIVENKNNFILLLFNAIKLTV